MKSKNFLMDLLQERLHIDGLSFLRVKAGIFHLTLKYFLETQKPFMRTTAYKEGPLFELKKD